VTLRLRRARLSRGLAAASLATARGDCQASSDLSAGSVSSHMLSPHEPRHGGQDPAVGSERMQLKR
jgi:hypothetical protein